MNKKYMDKIRENNKDNKYNEDIEEFSSVITVATADLNNLLSEIEKVDNKLKKRLLVNILTAIIMYHTEDKNDALELIDEIKKYIILLYNDIERGEEK